MVQGVALCANWVLNFVQLQAFDYLHVKVGFSGVFLLLAGFCVIGTVVVATCIIETKDRSLHDIERLFYDVSEESCPPTGLCRHRT